MTRRVILDVSSNNGNVNFGALKAAHPELVGVIVKATEGKGYTNPLYRSQTDNARNAGLFVGAYSFMHPSAAGVSDDSKWLATVEGDLKLGLWLDCEISDNLDPGTISARFQEDANYVRSNYHGPVGIYTGAWFWTPQTRGSGWAANFPAWIANYGGSGPATPYPWNANTVALWQFTDNYFGTGIDASVWWGDDNSWNKFVGGGVASVPVNPTGDDEVSVLPVINAAKDVGHPKALALAGFLIDEVQPGRDVSSPDKLAQAVRDFQTFFKVPGGADGILGTNTWKALLAIAVHQ